MKRQEFIKFTQTGNSKGKKPLITGKSITDPSYARTGRQLIFDPLNIEYRMKYPQGVPLDKENPMQFKEYDKLYPDQFTAMRQAREQVSGVKKKLDVVTKQPKQPKEPEPKTN